MGSCEAYGLRMAIMKQMSIGVAVPQRLQCVQNYVTPTRCPQFIFEAHVRTGDATSSMPRCRLGLLSAVLHIGLFQGLQNNGITKDSMGAIIYVIQRAGWAPSTETCRILAVPFEFMSEPCCSGMSRARIQSLECQRLAQVTPN